MNEKIDWMTVQILPVSGAYLPCYETPCGEIYPANYWMPDELIEKRVKNCEKCLQAIRDPHSHYNRKLRGEAGA